MAFSDNLVNIIHDKILLSDYIGRSVNLSKKGNDFIGLCPFHNEKTPSFTVSDDKGFFHCFGCGAHGDVISFIRNFEGKSFIEALETIADIAGIKIPSNNLENENYTKRNARTRSKNVSDTLDRLERHCRSFEIS